MEDNKLTSLFISFHFFNSTFLWSFRSVTSCFAFKWSNISDHQSIPLCTKRHPSPALCLPPPIWTWLYSGPAAQLHLGFLIPFLCSTSSSDFAALFLCSTSSARLLRKGAVELKFVTSCTFENILPLPSHLLNHLSGNRILGWESFPSEFGS